ncbi:MAG: thymidine phosphorylase [Acidobacteria bacterium]|nr:MAG: thymidine phosphorylase [Acidobacteriota bacterium]
MDPVAFRILERKRFDRPLSDDDVRTVVAGAASGEWPDAELAAFLMAVAIHGLRPAETRALTVAMLESGERWQLAQEIPTLGDKHSTGGVGDKVSLVLSPLLAACDRPVVMLTGRGLGHTGGTADKLESIPGLSLALDRRGCLEAIRQTGIAIGVPTDAIAPADKRIYALRDRTATVASLPLICASILSKKLATGAAAIVFDVKTGNGAFLTERRDAAALARLLVDTSTALGCRADALLTDMSQPLGRWVGHTAEVHETLQCLSGDGPPDLLAVTFALCRALSALTGDELSDAELQAAIDSGRARQAFERWALHQGADPQWVARPSCPLAPEEVVLEAPRAGVVAEIETRTLGELLATAGGGRLKPDAAIDVEVALRVDVALGDRVDRGRPLARLYLRRRDPKLEADFAACFAIRDRGAPQGVLLGRA